MSLGDSCPDDLDVVYLVICFTSLRISSSLTTNRAFSSLVLFDSCLVRSSVFCPCALLCVLCGLVMPFSYVDVLISLSAYSILSYLPTSTCPGESQTVKDYGKRRTVLDVLQRD